MLQNCKILIGYDNRGIVYESKDFVLREIFTEYLNETKEIYKIYKNFELNKLGIVETGLAESYGSNFLKHKKYIISYPHEWTISMFKESVLFHLDLFLNLDKYNLVLKDALLNNIVFDYKSPIFIDFLSIIKKDNLMREYWLVKDCKDEKNIEFNLFEKMFFPFILVPFILLTRKDYDSFRNILSNRACNLKNIKIPGWADLRDIKGKNSYIQNLFENFKLYSFLKRERKNGFISFCKNLKNYIEKIDVTPFKSDYASYYQDKKEDFDFLNYSNWKNKQKIVYDTLKKEEPETVLDLGANTGWFSILAANNGSKVIATDIDEASIDNLYNYSLKKNLNILSLMVPFDNLTKEIYGIENKKIFIKGEERFKSDMVFCLALLHHLVLGQCLDLDRVLKILSNLANKILILEFVGLDDNLIKGDPGFFKNLNKFNLQSYNLDLVIKLGLNYFKSVQLFDSNPENRKIIIFKK